MAFADCFSRFFHNHNVMAPFSRFYRAMVLKMNQHEDEATTSGVTDGAPGDHQNRVIFVNRPQPQKFVNNSISTAKYSIPSFIPLFLFEQFRRYSNCFFLLIALLQQIPDVSPTGRWTTLTPLILILSVSAIKEIVEDFKRHRADDETNRRKVEVLREGRWLTIRWEKLQVGDICKVLNNQFFPADLIMLSSSEPQGISFIETSNLDGETNLKIRQASAETARLETTRLLADFHATVQCEPPNRHLYEFNGMLKETNAKTIPLGLDQMLLRGAMLRNTAWVHGVVVYTGHETKLMKNSTKAPLKRSSIDRQTNTHILMLFLILLALSLLSAGFNELWVRTHSDWYIGLEEAQNTHFGFNFLTFLILYNNLIPISLQVTAEIVRFFQAKFIAMDSEMYHEQTDTPAMARTSNLNEELGMVKYVFSDKTGTLTCNVMEFHKCSIAEMIYNKPAENERLEDTLLYQNLMRNHPTAPVIREFLTMLAICHTVIPEMVDGKINYHAASPDERALVMGAARFGFEFCTRTPAVVRVRVPVADGLQHEEEYAVLNVIDFTSARKRMSVIVRTPTGEIKLYCKGADSVIYPRLASPAAARYADATLAHLEHFAAEGLRTLVFAVADIPDQLYQDWSNTYHKASIAIQDREQKVEEAALLIENNLRLLGATAIEDKLQDGVPETIAALLKANIHVWVLTGDKQETAINIAHSARLIHSSMPLIILNEDSLDAAREAVSRHAADFGENLRKQNEVALIIDGKTLKYAMGCDLKKDFLDLCVSCKVVVCCRVSPIQKAEVVEMVSAATGAVTLAIGDGANDVAMIQRASVGVGISGVEGLQAVCASDYSIAQFRFLLRLLLVHGAWNYSRISKLILYSFYKNICLYVIELWFAIYSAWSGQILFERWTIGFYNVIFTALPPFAIGLFDKLCSPEIMLRHPILYIPSQQGLLFNVRVFWVWAVNALLHSVLLFWLPVLLAAHHVLWPHGRDGGYLVLGNLVYTYVVLTVCLKAGLATHSWTWVTHVAIWGSVAMWFFFILIYSNIYPLILIGAVMRGMDTMVFSSLVFWLGLVLVPVATLVPDVIVTVSRVRTRFYYWYRCPPEERKKEDILDFLNTPRRGWRDWRRRLLRQARARHPPLLPAAPPATTTPPVRFAPSHPPGTPPAGVGTVGPPAFPLSSSSPPGTLAAVTGSAAPGLLATAAVTSPQPLPDVSPEPPPLPDSAAPSSLRELSAPLTPSKSPKSPDILASSISPETLPPLVLEMRTTSFLEPVEIRAIDESDLLVPSPSPSLLPPPAVGSQIPPAPSGSLIVLEPLDPIASSGSLPPPEPPSLPALEPSNRLIVPTTPKSLDPYVLSKSPSFLDLPTPQESVEPTSPGPEQALIPQDGTEAASTSRQSAPHRAPSTNSNIHNSAFKTMTEAVRESEIKQRDPSALLSQPRHSLTETARLLQNVRSVFSRRSATRVNMELELSHGFAFSQEEGGSVSQADVIRAYDTSQPRPAHS